MPPVADNLATVRDRMVAACRDAGRAADDVRLIAVSKLQPAARVQEAIDAGHRDFGENHVQALIDRRALGDPGDGVRGHLIGHVQSNKAKLAARADIVHAVDSVKIAQALARHVPAATALPILIQVNIAGEATKSGVAPGDTAALIDAIAALPALDLRGLMCIPEPGGGRRWFAALRELRDRLRAFTGISLAELSMGMSDDYPDAIREGATMVRVGTAIFGERTPT